MIQFYARTVYGWETNMIYEEQETDSELLRSATWSKSSKASLSGQTVRSAIATILPGLNMFFGGCQVIDL